MDSNITTPYPKVPNKNITDTKDSSMETKSLPYEVEIFFRILSFLFFIACIVAFFYFLKMFLRDERRRVALIRQIPCLEFIIPEERRRRQAPYRNPDAHPGFQSGYIIQGRGLIFGQ